MKQFFGKNSVVFGAIASPLSLISLFCTTFILLGFGFAVASPSKGKTSIGKTRSTSARAPAASHRDDHCSQAWGQLGNPYFRDKGLCAVDVLKIDSEGYRIPLENGFQRTSDKKFFFLAPGEAPHEAVGDPTYRRGSLCGEEGPNSLPVARFTEKRTDRLKHRPNKAFIVYGRPEDIQPLRLSYTPISEVRSFKCSFTHKTDHPPKWTRGYRGEKPSEFFYQADFSPSDEKCERIEWGIVQGNTCVALGRQISDCSDEGPRSDRGSGRPVGIFALKTPNGEFRYLLQDSTFWEYYGGSMVPLSSKGNLELEKSETAFEQPCVAH